MWKKRLCPKQIILKLTRYFFIFFIGWGFKLRNKKCQCTRGQIFPQLKLCLLSCPYLLFIFFVQTKCPLPTEDRNEIGIMKILCLFYNLFYVCGWWQWLKTDIIPIHEQQQDKKHNKKQNSFFQRPVAEFFLQMCYCFEKMLWVLYLDFSVSL